MLGEIRMQSPETGWKAKLKYWLSGGLISDSRSAIYFLATLTAVAGFIVFYAWQLVVTYAAIDQSLPAGRVYRSVRHATTSLAVDTPEREFASLAGLTADQTIAVLANYIERGDLTAVSSILGGSPQNRALLASLNEQARKELASEFRNAKFSYRSGAESDNYLIYISPTLGEKGEVRQTKFGIKQAPDGRWYIVFW